MRKKPDWLVYERAVARLMSDQLSTELAVTANAHVTGRITGIKRQIDVLIDARHNTDNSRRVIVDAKRRRRKIDVKDVEAFLGLMRDVEATHGYLVCPAGFTKAAQHRAQSYVSICLLPLDRLGEFDPASWPACRDPKCKTGRIFWDGYPEMTMVLQPVGVVLVPSIRKSVVHYVGKCDRCSAFHVKCTECDAVLLIPHADEDDVGHQCGCRPAWFWLASTECDRRNIYSAELHVVDLVNGSIQTVDRRSL
jgi:hypothetical protein